MLTSTMVSILWWLWLLPSLTTATIPYCPALELDWGTYQGHWDTNGVCKFSNIRFASPPKGSLRFAAPEYPPKRGQPLAPEYPGCIAITNTSCLTQHPPPISNSSASCTPKGISNFTEDCLFLDIYVPLTALDPNIQVPVVVWFYGGGYVTGSKTQFSPDRFPFYDGDGLVNDKLTGKPIIYVAGNYRLGAFGWLAGASMERNAQPNAGLLDQRKVLEFVQDNIHKLNGDKEQVSVWGESAGASSLLHHLVANFGPGGTSAKPLFNRMIIQSPAYSFLWDRVGSLDDTFKNFTKKAGCPNGDMKCLQNAPLENLISANQDVAQETACLGVLPYGPAVDGKILTDLATNLFSQGNGQPLDSLIVSHVNLEVKYSSDAKSFSFIPLPIRQHPLNHVYFDEFLDKFFAGDAYKDIRNNVSHEYRSSAKRFDQVARAQHMIMDSSFLCNTRVVLDAYMAKGRPVYAIDYDFLGSLEMATHASDLLPTFVNLQTNYTWLFECASKNYLPGWGARDISNYLIDKVGLGMQAYFVSHAITGNPNVDPKKVKGPSTDFLWSPAQINHSDKAKGGRVTHVMKPSFNPHQSAFMNNDTTDDQTANSVCDFWKMVTKNITAAYKKANPSVDMEAAEPVAKGHSVGFDAEL